LFAFGEGMSYSNVGYDDLSVREEQVSADGVVTASVRLTNSGRRPALETVQAYISDVVTSATWAGQELKAFKRVAIAPGETVVVTLEIPAAACSIVTADGVRQVEPGEFQLRVGPSSIASQQLTSPFSIRR
jgi:beta-glucosidase